MFLTYFISKGVKEKPWGGGGSLCMWLVEVVNASRQLAQKSISRDTSK